MPSNLTYSLVWFNATNINIASGYLHLGQVFLWFIKTPWILQQGWSQIYIKAHPGMHIFKVYLIANCHSPVFLHQGRTAERSGSLNLSSETMTFHSEWRSLKGITNFSNGRVVEILGFWDSSSDIWMSDPPPAPLPTHQWLCNFRFWDSYYISICMLRGRQQTCSTCHNLAVWSVFSSTTT